MLLVLALAVSGTTVLLGPPTTANASGPVTYTTVKSLAPTSWAASAEGRFVVNRFNGDADVIDTNTGSTVPLPTGETPILVDGAGNKVLVTTGSDLRVRNVAASTERIVDTTTGIGGAVELSDFYKSGFAMSRDGELVVFPSFNSTTLRGSLYASRGAGAPVDLAQQLGDSSLNRSAAEPAISADGRYVAFRWTDVLGGCTVPVLNCGVEVVRYDTTTGSTEVVSRTPSGTEAAGFDGMPAISGDGRYVAWISTAFDLVPGLTLRRLRGYLRDMTTATTHLLATADDAFNYGYAASISDDGRRVAMSFSGVIGSGTRTYIGPVARLVDLTDGTVQVLGPSAGGSPDGQESSPRVSASGTDVLFGFNGTNLVAAPCCPLVRAHVPMPASPPVALVYPPVITEPPIPTGPPLSLRGFAGYVGGSLDTVSPDGRYVGGEDGASIPTGVARYDLQSGDVTRLRLIGHGRMSTNGRYVGLPDCRSDLENGQQVKLTPNTVCTERTSAISGDGNTVLVVEPYVPAGVAEPTWLWHPGTSLIQFTTTVPGYEVLHRAWLNEDGTTLTVWRMPATGCGDACGQVVRFDTTTGASRVLPMPPPRTVDVSVDGRYVAFVSTDANIVPGLASGPLRAYRLDVASGAIALVHEDAVEVAMSSSGRVAYTAIGPVTEDGALAQGPRVHIWEPGRDRIIDRASDGKPPDFHSGDAISHSIVISGDGLTVAWLTWARNLVPGTVFQDMVVAKLDAMTTAPGSTAVVPERLLDTRPDTQAGYVGAKPAAGQTIELQVTGVGTTAVPADATSVIINVTATEANADGFVTVWPCGTDRPTASNLNVRRGQTVPNLVTVKVGIDGRVCLYTQVSMHLLADVAGWYPAGASFTPVVPERLLDTRPDALIGYRGAKPLGGETVQLRVAGAGTTNVPTNAAAVVLNVTGTEATADGFVTVWPCGTSRPNASNLNLVGGGTRPNLVVVKLGTDGAVCLFTQAGTHLVADIAGWFPSGSSFTPVVPERLLDTRPDSQIGYSGPTPAPGQTVELHVISTGTTNTPSDAKSVLLNLTGAQASGDGFVTAWPCGADKPTASNLNLVVGETAPNLVDVRVGVGGNVCLFTQSGTHLVADIAGYDR